MAVAFHSDSIEIQEEDVENKTAEDDADYVNVGTRTSAQQKPTQKSVMGQYKLVGLVVGLLCVVQALLNIGLRLSLSTSQPCDCDSLTREKAQCLQEKTQLKTSFDQLQKRCDSVTEERDNLKRRLCESDGFKLDGDQCYYISTEKKTWEGSRRYCRDRQSNLMVINSKEKQDFVERINQRVWLGLSDREKEGSFKWVDGTPLTYPTYWAPGEPDNNGNGDCVTFLNAARREHGRGWHDTSCVSKNPWICERVI